MSETVPNNYVTLSHNNLYEISTEYPDEIFYILNKHVHKETPDTQGYIRVKLQNKSYFKHKIIADMFLENPNEYKYVTHINGDIKYNHINNLMWCDKNTIQRNRCKYNYVNELPEHAKQINNYGKYTFNNLYYGLKDLYAYIYTGNKYKVIPLEYNSNNKLYVIDTDGVSGCIKHMKLMKDIFK